MAKNYKDIYENDSNKRQPYLDRGKQISALTIDRLGLDKQRTNQDSYNSTLTPYSDIGERITKGVPSLISRLLNPINGTSFNLETSVNLKISDAERIIFDAIYVQLEKRLNSFKNQKSYRSYQYTAALSTVPNGQFATKVHSGGYMPFELDSFVSDRYRNTLQYAVFKECKIDKEGKEYNQYIGVDYGENKVWQQVEDKQPTLMDGEQAIQYVISSLLPPESNKSYARSILDGTYGVLKSINLSWKHLEESQAICAKNIQIFSGPEEIDPSYISRLPNGTTIRLLGGPDVLRWHGVDSARIAAWQWIGNLTAAREQQVLAKFGIGLLERAGQMQTAYEVSKVIEELNSLLGPVIIHWSDTFTKPIIEAEIAVLGIKEDLQNILAREGWNLSEKNKQDLIVPVVTSGLSSLSRSEEAYKSVNGIGEFVSKLGVTPEAQQEILGSIRLSKTLKLFLDGIGANTGEVYQEYVAPSGEVQSPSNMPTEMVNAAQALPPELLATLPKNVVAAGPAAVAQYLLNENNK